MLDGPMRRKLTPMVEQMVGLHREGLRQRVIESHRQEADDIIAKSIERHDADAMDIAARVGRSKPASVEREHLLQALVDKSRFIEDMRGVRTGIDDDTRASQREVYQQRLVLAQHEAALEQAHGTGGEKAARAYLDALSKDLNIPDTLRPILARRLGIDIAHLEDRRRTKALRDARRQAHDVLSEFSQIRTGEPLAPFEDDHTDDDDMAAFQIWRAYDRWGNKGT